jgi:hypothetical protein
MSTLLEIKQQIATYLGRDEVTDLNPSTELSGINIDLGTYAVNEAMLRIQRMVDLKYCENTYALSIASTGTALSAATGLSGAVIKRVESVQLPISGGDYIPIEFLTEKEWTDRVQRAIGRQEYDAAATLDELGLTQGNPLAYQRGSTIYLAPAAQFTFPVAARIDVYSFLAPVSADADNNFLTNIAPDYLLWQGVLEVNKFYRRHVVKQEGNIDEASVKEYRDEAQASLLQWNREIEAGTSTPPPEE